MTPRPIAIAALADLVCVLVFAAVGRASHEEAVGPVGVLVTVWPFATGWAVGWVLVLLVRAARTRPSGALAGVLVWVPTVALGMVLRTAVAAGVQVSFVVVATVVLAAFVLGWRGVVALVARARRRGPANAQV